MLYIDKDALCCFSSYNGGGCRWKSLPFKPWSVSPAQLFLTGTKSLWAVFGGSFLGHWVLSYIWAQGRLKVQVLVRSNISDAWLAVPQSGGLIGLLICFGRVVVQYQLPYKSQDVTFSGLVRLQASSLGISNSGYYFHSWCAKVLKGERPDAAHCLTEK